MLHDEGLAKKEREAIYKLLIERDRLTVEEIDDAIGIKAPEILKHLEMMQEVGIVEQKDNKYLLTKEAERFLPLLSHVVVRGMNPLPIVLVALMDGDKVLLMKRGIKPYKNYWSLIGGKIHVDERFEDASIRQVQDKVGMDGEFESINAVLHEKVEGENIIKHSFIVFLVKMKATQTEIPDSLKDKLEWVPISKLKDYKIIPSDNWLLETKLNSKLQVSSAHMFEKDGELGEFRVVE